MGNTDAKQNNSLKDWQKIDTDNGLEIYKNIKTDELAEKRIVVIDGEIDIKKSVKIYKMRQNNNDALVRAFGSQELTKKAQSFVSCAGGNKIFVLTEKMPHRLSQLPQLTFPQSLLFLRESLRAYERLFKEYGPVEVTKEMIGVNYCGEVKSWLNSNWALNHRNHEYGNLRSKKVSQLTREQYLAYREQYLDEPEMIKNVISVIEKRCEEGVFPQAFKEEVISQSGSFRKLLLYLKDFVEFNQIYVPDRVNYEELVNSNYQTRLERQLNFNVTRGESQTLANQNRQVQNGVQGGMVQQGRVNGLAGMGSAGQQGLGQISLSNQQVQIQPNRFLTYEPASQSFQGLSQPRIPQPFKQSPVSSDMGQVTFSQSNRSYNQQEGRNTQLTTNYNWPTNNQNIYTPSFQKVQQPPLIGNYPASQSFNYNIGVISTQQQTVIKPGYTAPVIQGGYQGGFSSSFGGLNAREYQPSANLANGEFSYSKYTDTGYGTSLEKAKPTTNSFSLANNTYNYSSTYSPTTPGGSFTIGGIDSAKSIANQTTSGYTQIQTANQPVSNNIISNKWSLSGPSTTSYVTETYNYTNTQKPVQTLYTTQTRPAYSFDGRHDFGSKFGDGYTGTGYSNTLTKYQSQSTDPSSGFNVQGKYAQAFSSLLNPSLKGQTFEQITSAQSQTKNGSTAERTVITQTVITTNQHKRESSSNLLNNSGISGSNVQGKNVVSEQQNPTPKNMNPLQAFTNMVERVSNDVSESVLKIE